MRAVARQSPPPPSTLLKSAPVSRTVSQGEWRAGDWLPTRRLRPLSLYNKGRLLGGARPFPFLYSPRSAVRDLARRELGEWQGTWERAQPLARPTYLFLSSPSNGAASAARRGRVLGAEPAGRGSM